MIEVYIKNGHWEIMIDGTQIGKKQKFDQMYLDNPTPGFVVFLDGMDYVKIRYDIVTWIK